MSKKYIESMNKITVDDNMKKRILEKVSEESKKENNIILENKRINRYWRRTAGVTAACCALFVCISLNTQFPELFNANKANINSNAEEVKSNTLEIGYNNSEDDNKYKADKVNESENINKNDHLISSDYIVENEVNYSNNKNENKYESKIIESKNSGQISNTEKNANISSYDEINNKKYQDNEKVQSNIPKEEIIDNNHNDMISNKDTLIEADNNGKDYLNDDVTETKDLGIDVDDDTSKSGKVIEGTSRNIQNEMGIPEVLQNSYETPYILRDSDDVIKVVYKDKEYGNGELTISSKENVCNDKRYSSIENIKTSKGDAVIKISENGKEKYADWKYDNKYYLLQTEGNVDNENIIYIIESCK